MRIRSGRAFWLSAAILLLAVVACAWLLIPRSRITQENCDRIKLGMNEAEVTEILGEMNGPFGLRSIELGWKRWSSGPNQIGIRFSEGRVIGKEIRLASPLKTLEWYAKKAAEKIGIE